MTELLDFAGGGCFVGGRAGGLPPGTRSHGGQTTRRVSLHLPAWSGLQPQQDRWNTVQHSSRPSLDAWH